MSRRSALGALLVLAVCSCVLDVAPAGAGSPGTLTQSEADAIALRASKARSGTHDAILFGLPSPLPAGAQVAPADPNAPVGQPGTRQATTLDSPAWLYWLDKDPYARFSHPSTLLLVDDTDGQVTRRPMQWYPLVNGQEPPFIASRADYDAERYRVFARERPLPTSKDASAGTSNARSEIAPSLLANDCVIMIGGYNSPGIGDDFPAVQRWASSVGLRAFYTTRNGPSGSAPPASDRPPDGAVLAENVATLTTTDHCTDVLIYLSGHGVREGRGPPTVFTGKTVEGADGAEPVVTHEGVDAGEIASIIRAHPTIGFKVKVDSCFAGRFVEVLTDPRLPALENLLIIEASSPAGEASYMALSAKRRSDNPDQIGEFTNQNLAGLRIWASDPDEVASTSVLDGSLLANAMERAFVLGRSANRAITARGVKPVIWVQSAEVLAAKAEDPRSDVVVCAGGAPASTVANDILEVRIAAGDAVEVKMGRSVEQSLQDQFSFAATVTITHPGGRTRKFLVQVHDGRQTIGEVDPTTGAPIGDARTIELSGDTITIGTGELLPPGTVVKAAAFDLTTTTSPRTCDEASLDESAAVSESPVTFFTSFGRAMATGDRSFLFDRLDPRVVARYGAEQCRAYLNSLDVPRYSVAVLAVGEPGPWDWSLDGRTDHVADAIPVAVRSTDDGVTSREFEAHVVMIDDRVHWFTDCGTPA